ncbi:Putative type I secretion protein [Xenorhabdus nematophila str. Anatoliense]|nr:Putative type I secretion protein [Xenorhabdus nematophila str. Anatoliense]CEE95554.1 Putative type I secretion protein [Xenorhabdus nematophila str. Anatoliense]
MLRYLKIANKRTLLFPLCLAMLLIGSPIYSGFASALSLTEAYALALQNDPTFQMALKEWEAGQEEKNIGLAKLLPKLSFNYQNAPKNWQKMESHSVSRLGKHIKEDREQQYNCYSSAIILTQPLIDFETWARYQIRYSYALMSDARFRADSQQLVVRVVNSYIAVAYAQDRLAQIVQQRAAYEEQLKQNQKLFSSGEGTRTDVTETQTRYSQVFADELTVKDELDAATRDLQLLVGIPLLTDLPVQLLHTVRQDLSQAKYDYIKAWIGLLNESGQLNDEHIKLITHYFG